MKCDEDAVPSSHTSSPAEQDQGSSGKPEAAWPAAMHSQTGLKDILSESREPAGGLWSWIRREEDPVLSVHSSPVHWFSRLIPTATLLSPRWRGKKTKQKQPSGTISLFNLISRRVIRKWKHCQQITNHQHYECTANGAANVCLAFSHCTHLRPNRAVTNRSKSR